MKGEQVREIVNNLLDEKSSITNRQITRLAGVSRQWVHRLLQKLVEDGELVREGAGRSVRYRRPGPVVERERYPIEGLVEDRVWSGLASGSAWLKEVQKNAYEVLQYAFTEMLNNAIEHSSSPHVDIALTREPKVFSFEVADEGVGIFNHLCDRLGLGDQLQALQELTKGKVTTDPEHHTGEGIFFVSRIADFFEIESGGLLWMVDNQRGDHALGTSPSRPGTRVRFEIRPDTGKTLGELFARYTDDFQFDKTDIVVKLFDQGVRFISRSEARRLMHGLERFGQVTLDFKGVLAVGQGFADEVFRVWARRHPDTRLQFQNASPPVSMMIRRTGLPWAAD